MKAPIATIINFCSNDVRFIDKCIEEAKKFSQCIVIPVCDHFFDGTPENHQLLKEIYGRHPDCHFIEYAYQEGKLYSKFLDVSSSDQDWMMYRYGNSRYLGYLYLPEEIEYALFVDVDEISDGNRFLKWLNTFPYQEYDALRFECYYYFREATLQAKSWTENAILMRKSVLSQRVLLNSCDRVGAFCLAEGRKLRNILGADKKPLIHHYCWVKTKEESLKKAATHGHEWTRDLQGSIEKEFSENFKGTDFVFSFEYKRLRKPFFDPLIYEPLVQKASNFSHVKKIRTEDAFRRELALEFQI